MGNTKIVKCIDCEQDTEVSKFASPKSAKCEECKDITEVRGDTTIMEEIEPEVNITEDIPPTTGGPRIDKKANKALQKLACPYHPDTQMKLIGLVNSDWGDSTTMQCRVKGCYRVVEILEQPNGPIRSKIHGDGFEPDLPDEEILRLFKEGILINWWEDQKL